MASIFRSELNEICAFSKRNYGQIVVITLATLFMLFDRYHPVTPEWLGSLVYFLALPILAIIVLLRKNPLDFGLRIGNWRLWGWYLGVTALVGIPVLLAVSRIPQLKDYYLEEQFNLLLYFAETVAYLFAWEFLFRGFLLFGLKERMKEVAILVQMMPFALLHFGKPEIETISTVLTGIYFGYVAYRGNSFWPAFIIHLLINIIFVVLANYL